MAFSSLLDDRAREVAGLVDLAKRQHSAAQKLQKLAETGAVRDYDKQRAAILELSERTYQSASALTPIEFDIEEYLAVDGQFLVDLKGAADTEGLKLFERDGVVYCYPVLLRLDAPYSAVRIDKKLVAAIRPEVLVDQLKKLQQKPPSTKPDQTLKQLSTAYPFVLAKSGTPPGGDVRLRDIYAILTMMPQMKKEYSELEFTRDLYALDASGEDRIGNLRMSLSASTATREAKGSVLRFVDPNGHEKVYAFVRFTPFSEGSV